MKDFRPRDFVNIAIVILIIAVIIYFIPTLALLGLFFLSCISGILLYRIIGDKIEKTRVKKKMTGIETNTPNHVMDRIKKTLEMRKPSKIEILANLYALQANDSLSNFEFFDIIGETYQLNPKFFMLSIFPKIRPKFSKVYGDEGMRIMDKYILEKFYLDEGEQIIYELNGKIRQKVPKKYTIRVLHGTIYVTNSRIIAQGKFAFHLYQSAREWIFESGESPKKAKNVYISSSGPCYGYGFPIKNLYNLNRFTTGSKIRKLSYLVPQKRKITINISKKEYHGDKLFEILDKNQNRNNVIN